MSIQSIRHFQSQIKKLDKAIARHFEGISNTLHTIPIIGLIYTASILAEIGQVKLIDSRTRSH